MRHAIFDKRNVEPKIAVTRTAAICLKLKHTMNGLVIIIRFFISSGNWDQTGFVFKQKPNIEAFWFAFDVVTFCISFMFSESHLSICLHIIMSYMMTLLFKILVLIELNINTR